MSLIACGECGSEVSTKASACQKCGAKVPHINWWLWVPLGLVFGFFAIGLVGFATLGNTKQAKEQRAIEKCWEEQARKSLDPTMQRFMALACETMESEFEKRFGRKP